MKRWRVFAGDCVERMRELEDESVDSVVCDPPYLLSFMSAEWDSHAPEGAQAQAWHLLWAREALRVLKPGGHLLAFGGTRTYHRLTCALEDAGFEIRDCVVWLYGSGFPKSLDVSKAIDKASGAKREVTGLKTSYRPNGRPNANPKGIVDRTGPYQTSPSTDAACQWDGWGTALKPAFEPIVVARKPLVGTVASNVLKYGTGALNIDGCRVGNNPGYKYNANRNGTTFHGTQGDRIKQNVQKRGQPTVESTKGRWPANVILDKRAGKSLDAQSGYQKDGVAVMRNRDGRVHNEIYGAYRKPAGADVTFGSGGGASRFFYCAKVSKKERREGLDAPHKHPTTKPVALMRYLIRLVTPRGGLVLDPFMGSGTTGVASLREAVRFVGIEREREYRVVAVARLRHTSDRVVRLGRKSK